MDTTSSSILKIIQSVKQYLGYQKRYIKLDLTEKLTLLLTALILGCVIFVIALIAIVFAGISIASALQNWVSPWLSYAIVSCIFVLSCVVIYLKRQTFIVGPLTHFFANILLDDDNTDNHPYGDNK